MNGVLTKQEKRFEYVSHIVLTLLSLLAIIPFWLLIAASFSDSKYAIRAGYRFFPAELSLDAYKYIFEQWNQVGRAYLVTIVVTVTGTLIGLAVVSLLSFALSRKRVPGSKAILALILVTMLFSGGIVPQYMIYNNMLQLRNTLTALILPNLLLNGFYVLLVRNYILNSIPSGLEEAMEIDGAGQFGVYFRLVLPLSTPILATMGLMTAVSYWNDWTNGLYYIRDARLYSIQQLLNEINNNINFLANNADQIPGVDLTALPTATMRLAITVVAILPIMIAYPFFQKYFAKGLTLGAVKG